MQAPLPQDFDIEQSSGGAVLLPLAVPNVSAGLSLHIVRVTGIFRLSHICV